MIKHIINDVAFWLARRIPRRVLYYCVIQSWVYASTEAYPHLTPDQITWDMVYNYLAKAKK